MSVFPELTEVFPAVPVCDLVVDTPAPAVGNNADRATRTAAFACRYCASAAITF